MLGSTKGRGRRAECWVNVEDDSGAGTSGIAPFDCWMTYGIATSSYHLSI